jgi:hypothetical protein
MKAIKIICLIAAILVFIISLMFFGWWAMKDYFVFGDSRFDQVRWITAQPTAEEPCYRGDMAFDLKQRLLLRGMPMTTATILLGRPTWEDYGQIEYELGNCLWREHGLRLYFDENDRLIRSRIVQH